MFSAVTVRTLPHISYKFRPGADLGFEKGGGAGGLGEIF